MIHRWCQQFLVQFTLIISDFGTSEKQSPQPHYASFGCGAFALSNVTDKL